MKLTLANYKDLNPYFNLTKGAEPITPLTYAMWDYYGYHMHYEIYDGIAIIWGMVDEVNRPMFMLPYCPPERYREILGVQRSVVKERTGMDCNAILLYGAYAHIPELVKTGFAVRTNYIYDLAKLSELSGSALQKKRNNYNFYFKTYGNRTRFEKLTPELLEQEKEAIVAFVNRFAEDETGERAFLRDFLPLFATDSFSGSIMYLDGQINGVTIGYLRDQTYEVFVERSDRSIRGTYQYLLVNNLQINDIQAKYMDRQDDANIEGIRISKESYKPLKIIERVEMQWIE